MFSSFKEKTCNIDGLCYGEGESNPSSPCLRCRPDLSTHTWTAADSEFLLNRSLEVMVWSVRLLDTLMVLSLPGNEPPVLHPPPPLDPLRSHQGHNFSYQLQAQDPEGLAVIFSLDSSPQGASLSPAGLLTWTASAAVSDTHTFLFTASDECGAETRASLQVNTCVSCCGI